MALRLSLGLAALLLATAAGAADEATPWLRRMGEAMRQLDYRGVLAFIREGQFDAVEIERDGQRQRLLALTGERREVISEAGVVTVTWPNGERTHAPLAELTPFTWSDTALAALDRHYRMRVAGRDRIAGYEAIMVDAEPVDAARYTYRFWIEPQSGMLLASLLQDSGGVAVERQVFTSLTLGEIRADAASPATPKVAARAIAITGLPEGFELIATPPAEAGERQWVFSDGLASVSIYVGDGEAALRGAAMRGAVNAFGRDLSGTHVVVVGELPAATVERVATQFDAKALERR